MSSAATPLYLSISLDSARFPGMIVDEESREYPLTKTTTAIGRGARHGPEILFPTPHTLRFSS